MQSFIITKFQMKEETNYFSWLEILTLDSLPIDFKNFIKTVYLKVDNNIFLRLWT